MGSGRRRDGTQRRPPFDASLPGPLRASPRYRLATAGPGLDEADLRRSPSGVRRSGDAAWWSLASTPAAICRRGSGRMSRRAWTHRRVRDRRVDDPGGTERQHFRLKRTVGAATSPDPSRAPSLRARSPGVGAPPFRNDSSRTGRRSPAWRTVVLIGGHLIGRSGCARRASASGRASALRREAPVTEGRADRRGWRRRRRSPSHPPPMLATAERPSRVRRSWSRNEPGGSGPMTTPCPPTGPRARSRAGQERPRPCGGQP